MVDQPTEPSNAELLERIAQLEKQNAKLFSLVADLQEGLDIFMSSATKQFINIDDLLVPVAEKVFPRLEETLKQIDAIVPPCNVDIRINMKLDERPS